MIQVFHKNPSIRRVAVPEPVTDGTSPSQRASKALRQSAPMNSLRNAAKQTPPAAVPEDVPGLEPNACLIRRRAIHAPVYGGWPSRPLLYPEAPTAVSTNSTCGCASGRDT